MLIIVLEFETSNMLRNKNDSRRRSPTFLLHGLHRALLCLAWLGFTDSVSRSFRLPPPGTRHGKPRAATPTVYRATGSRSTAIMETT